MTHGRNFKSVAIAKTPAPVDDLNPEVKWLISMLLLKKIN